MAEDILAKRIGGLSDEIKKIPEALKSLVPDPDRKYYDENLGKTIEDAVLKVLGKVSEVEAGKNYYHSELIELVTKALGEVISKIGNPKIDFSPIMKLAADINSDNKKILNAILDAPKPDDSKYEKVIEMLILLNQRNNEFYKSILEKQTPVIDISPKREVASWKFVHRIEYNRITETEAFPKYTE